MTNVPDIQTMMSKIKKMEKGEKLDLSSDEDLSIAVMNLISIEEHLFFTAQKTKKNHYFDLLFQIREMRKSLLKKLIKSYEGEVWCISKHLLAASMRLMEVGTKALTKGQKQQAQEFFQNSYQLYSLFWGLNLGAIKTDTIKGSENRDITWLSDDAKPQAQASMSVFDKLGTLVQKALDCCRE
jgi:hypothetical protein